MNFFHTFRKSLMEAIHTLETEGVLPQGLVLDAVTVEPPRDTSHGDIATNAALVLSKPSGKAPRVIAEALAAKMAAHPDVSACEVAGPGFLNFRLTSTFWQGELQKMIAAGQAYGASTVGGSACVNVEYVSANPTGPMHIGHARGAVVGDALARLLKKAGFNVVKEYYINDAGGQVQELARSTYQRYREVLGREYIPGQYGGEYLIPVAKTIAEEEGDRFLDQDEPQWLAFFQARAVEAMMILIREDLALLGVHHDVFTSEKKLVDDGLVQKALDRLSELGLIYEGVLEPPKGKVIEDYEPRPQTLFKATDFGDDVDRPLKKSDGHWTYMASDIAYHFDKFQRGAKSMVNVWGADHGGYVKRLTSAVKAITENSADVDVKLCQMVKFLENGEALKMSKRSGVFVTLAEATERVGKDVIRFIMLTRKNDAPLDFDFGKAMEHSKDNPVFYVQYASARCHSILRHADEAFSGADLSASALSQVDLTTLTDENDLEMMKLLASFPRQVEVAAAAHEPHRIAYYLYEVAAAFHGLWNKGKDETHLRFLLPDNLEATKVRLSLVLGVLTVLRSGLEVLGIEAVEELRA
ncbi:MAG: arginine--tRNA ligase [Alphaproteobacteria bacterium]|nr:arginine--tRNA ligase [Alphaproteobacteria bacterium]